MLAAEILKWPVLESYLYQFLHYKVFTLVEWI